MTVDPAQQFYREDHVAAALRRFGLDVPTLTRAAEAGEAERRTCTPFDPTILGGVVAWGRTIRALRELLVPKGWQARDVLGLPLVVSPAGTFAFTVATGDQNTGMKGVGPSTKYKKGVAFPVTGERQLSILGPSDPLSPPVLPDEVWVLLLARTTEELRLEISRPSHRHPSGAIGFHADRIVLPAIALDQPAPQVDPDDDDDYGVDVSVERI